MKKTILFLILAVSLGGTSLQAQDTLWQKLAPLSNYYNNDWIDTTDLIVEEFMTVAFSRIVARQFTTEDTLQVYGIAAMMVNFESFAFSPTAYYPTLQSYLNAHFPEDPTFDNCEESLVLFQYDASSSPVMQQVGDSLPVHILHTPVSYYIISNTPEFNTAPKPVYERYYAEPQAVYDTFYVGFTQNDGGYSKVDGLWRFLRPGFLCMSCGYRDMRDVDETIATLVQPGESYANRQPYEWHFSSNYIFNYYFIFPILTPPDTTVNPMDTTVNPNDTIVPCDTLTTGYLVLHSGNTVVIAPGDTLVISGDTLVNTGDTLVVNLGDTVVIGGSTLVLDVGDTLFVNPGDTLFVGPDGSIHVNPGGTFVVGSGGDPGAGLRQTDMVSRYTSVAPNPATERATVLSSFGLERIEVYDSQGRQTLTLPATGYRATLDLSAWPRGTYLLRITTPLGPTTKKLLVQ